MTIHSPDRQLGDQLISNSIQYLSHISLQATIHLFLSKFV